MKKIILLLLVLVLAGCGQEYYSQECQPRREISSSDKFIQNFKDNQEDFEVVKDFILEACVDDKGYNGRPLDTVSFNSYYEPDYVKESFKKLNVWEANSFQSCPIIYFEAGSVTLDEEVTGEEYQRMTGSTICEAGGCKQLTRSYVYIPRGALEEYCQVKAYPIPCWEEDYDKMSQDNYLDFTCWQYAKMPDLCHLEMETDLDNPESEYFSKGLLQPIAKDWYLYDEYKYECSEYNFYSGGHNSML